MNGDGHAERATWVVVVTRDRPESLQRCLAALSRQTAAYHLVVVDDGSADSAAEVVADAAARAGAELVRGAGSGPAAARNAGARTAGGGVVLFLDDDCEPDHAWVATLAAACPVGGSAAGETVNADPDDPFAAASQLLTSELQRGSQRADGALGFAATSNLAVDRELMLRLPFDEAFPTAAGEDREWCARAAAAGAAPRYEPAAIVRHRQQLGGLRGFWRQQVRYGRGAALLRTRFAGELAPPRVRLRLVRAGFSQGLRVGALVTVAQLAVAWGYLRERVGR